jgi:hypothetical protein
MAPQGSLELLNDPVAKALLGSVNLARLAYTWLDGRHHTCVGRDIGFPDPVPECPDAVEARHRGPTGCPVMADFVRSC